MLEQIKELGIKICLSPLKCRSEISERFSGTRLKDPNGGHAPIFKNILT